MKDAKAYELLIGIFIVFMVFSYLYPGSTFYAILLGFAALTGVIFFLRGIVEWIFGKGTGSMWIGAAICFLLIILFNGLGIVISTFNLVMTLITFVIISIASLF